MNLMKSLKIVAIVDGIACYGLAASLMIWSLAEGIQTNLFVVGMLAFFAGAISLNSFNGFRHLESRIEALERNQTSGQSTH
jgi:hypothetical protein